MLPGLLTRFLRKPKPEFDWSQEPKTLDYALARIDREQMTRLRVDAFRKNSGEVFAIPVYYCQDKHGTEFYPTPFSHDLERIFQDNRSNLFYRAKGEVPAGSGFC